MVRASTGPLRFLRPDVRRSGLPAAVPGPGRPGSAASRDMSTGGNGPAASVGGRVPAVRKSGAATGTAQEKPRHKAAKDGGTPGSPRRRFPADTRSGGRLSRRSGCSGWSRGPGAFRSAAAKAREPGSAAGCSQPC